MRTLSLLLIAASAFGQQRNFVTCPIVRDTKTVPCFLAEYEGETYYLGIQQDITTEFHPPQLKHEVLVEGTVAEGPRVCGGIPLRPVTISVIKEVNLACNVLLPAEPGIEAPPAPRGAGPSSRRTEPPPAARAPLTGPQEFTLQYEFNDDRAAFAALQTINEAAAYAKRIKATNVKVSGFRATTLLSNGQRMTENTGLAENRTQSVTTLLQGLGLTNVTSQSKSEAEPADGQTDASHRRVVISVIP